MIPIARPVIGKPEADAAVSVLALIGLGAGRLFGWVWMDPVMGIVGMLVAIGVTVLTPGVIIGTVLGDTLLAALRRLAEENESARAMPEAPPAGGATQDAAY